MCTHVGYRTLERIPPRQGPVGKPSVSSLASLQGAALSPAKSGPEKQRKQLWDLYFFSRLSGSPTNILKPFWYELAQGSVLTSCGEEVTHWLEGSHFSLAG